MNSIHRLALLGAVAFSFALANLIGNAETASAILSQIPRQKLSLDQGWRFRLGDPADVTTNVTFYPEITDLKKLQLNQISGPGSETCLETNRVDVFTTHAGENISFVQPKFDDSSWQSLNLPHDWAIELPFDRRADYDHGFKAIGDSVFGTNNIGWYRHTFTLPESDAGKKLWLEFGGVYRNCLVWLNGHILGRNVSGYSSFYFDATPYAKPGGTNVLVLRVDASRFEGWFYEGAGIYRHVWLTKLSPVHVTQWGTFVFTSKLAGSNATVAIQTEVTNQDTSATSGGTLTSMIYDETGKAVAGITSPIHVSTGEQETVTQSVSFVANLWVPKTPYLYSLVTTISNANTVVDTYKTPFGVRTVKVDADKGVLINGEPLEILGVCNHQDHAGVGVALPDRLQYYRVERLLQMGANAYRTSHNEPTAELLDACDQLGMLVLDENRRIGTNAEPLSELTRQIRRDRNHPSVFMWSLGNEETSLQGNDTGAAVVKAMQDAVHELDPTRVCTIAMNNEWGKGFSKVIDVQGFNYRLNEMDDFHHKFPKQPSIGTETASQVGTRGIYTNDTSKCFVTAYDLHNDMAGWGEPAEQWWPHYHSRSWSSGGFAWTGFDYRGEPTPYYKNFTNISSHFGTLDTCGFFKDNAYYYQANWSLKPVLHLFPHWNWEKPGQPIDVWAFGNCEAVELFVNGVGQGRKLLNSRNHVEWKVPFAPGAIRAVGYRNGAPVLTNTIVTAGLPAHIQLTADRSVILADGRDVSVVSVAVLDAKGNICPTATNDINLTIAGGTIIGVGNGNPVSHEADKASHRRVFNGLAQVIVQSTEKSGYITLAAISPGLKAMELKLTAVKTLPPPTTPTGVSAVAGNGQVTVSWDIVPGASTYNIYRAMKRGGAYSLIAENVSGGALGYVDHSVVNGTAYFYVVSANGNGESKKSVAVSATPEAPVYWKWAATPPMGWNSYDAWGTSVTEGEVVANAQFMREHLLSYGWKYIVIDARWYDSVSSYDDRDFNKERNGAELFADEFGRMLPATNRFPSAADGKGFKPLADQIHAMGLKFGFHMMRGIPRQAVLAMTQIEGSGFTAADAGDTNNKCGWCPDMFGVRDNEAGQAWYDSCAKLWAGWGIDFIKVDDLSNPYHSAEIEMIRKAIDKCGRPIVLSTSPGPADPSHAKHISANANMWRISGDFWDQWGETHRSGLSQQFDLLAKWQGIAGPGHWPDADMIPFGHIGIKCTIAGPDRQTRFTRDEQRTLMSLWVIAPSPLMLGANLPDLDEWTLSLLTNDEVLAVNQDQLGSPARRVSQNQGVEVWVKCLKDGSKAIGLFNRNGTAQDVRLDWGDAGLVGKQKLRDLWLHKNLGSAEANYSSSVPAHGAVLLRATPQ